MLNTSFDGASGFVQLDSITASRRPESAVFAYVNNFYPGRSQNITFQSSRTAVYANDTWSIFVGAHGVDARESKVQSGQIVSAPFFCTSCVWE